MLVVESFLASGWGVFERSDETLRWDLNELGATRLSFGDTSNGLFHQTHPRYLLPPSMSQAGSSSEGEGTPAPRRSGRARKSLTQGPSRSSTLSFFLAPSAFP